MDASHILDGLNQAQKDAVTSEASVLQILAPPGSGKTKTLTSRVSWLLFHHNYKPWDVICLTFTIKSAREMKERIAKQIGEDIGSKLILGTFHSVCLRYLRRYGHLIDLLKGFDIADSSDSQAIVKRIIKQKNLTIDPSTARARISHNKAKNKTYQECQREQKKSVEVQEFNVVYEEYQTYLEAANLLDYDDLLVRCVELLRDHPQCVSNVEAVLIDEFQDTNHIQFDLMRLFAGHRRRITTVGDPDQSIYGWRSAEIENLSKMQRMYRDTIVLNLKNNYRSSPAILKAAQMVIEQDMSRPPKTMVATHCGGSAPVLRRLFSPKTQAGWIVNEIKRCKAVTGNCLFHFSDFAILIRSAALSRQIETSLAHAGIPYRMVGGLRFFDRKEIKVLLDYIRVAAHPENNDAIARIINYPTRGIGDKTIKTIQEKAASTKRLWWDLISDELGHKRPIGLKDNVKKGLRHFHDIITTCNKAIENEVDPKYPLALLELLIKKLDFEKHLQKEFPEDHEQRWANVEELKVQASEYCNTETGLVEVDSLPELEGIAQEQANPAQEALTKFLGNIALSTELQSESDLDDDGNTIPKVTISTIHAAKGLEWPVVFIPCVYKGSIPHSRSEDEDEERRLLYVAMTRAQALLYMTIPSQGQMDEEYTLSPFLDERNVLRYLAERAPSIYDQLNTISSILRRPQPPPGPWQITLDSLDCIEDDEITWPLDGSKGLGDDGSNHFKVKSTSEVEASSSYQTLRESIRTEQASQSAPALTGFVTATSQLKRHLLDETSWPSDSKDKVPLPKKSRAGRSIPGQTKIGSFFTKSDPVATLAREPELPPLKLLREPQSDLSIPRPTRTTILPNAYPQPRTLTGTQVRQPLTTLSPGITNHRVARTVGIQGYKTTMYEYHSATNYPLFSSSPIKSVADQDDQSTCLHNGHKAQAKQSRDTDRPMTITAAQEQMVGPRRQVGLSGGSFVPWSSRPGSGVSFTRLLNKPHP